MKAAILRIIPKRDTVPWLVITRVMFLDYFGLTGLKGKDKKKTS